MTEFIPKHCAIERLYRRGARDCNREVKRIFRIAAHEIERIPAADVVPRREGSWLPVRENGWTTYCCNQCYQTIGEPQVKPHRHCPDCGAFMNGRVVNGGST